VVQWVLSAQVDTSEKLQHHNLFQIFFINKDCRVRTIIDGGNCNNFVIADFMAKTGLMTCLHTHPYYIQWLNNNGKAKVTHTAHVHFSNGTYHDNIQYPPSFYGGFASINLSRIVSPTFGL
jgi:hypothetical protein